MSLTATAIKLVRFGSFPSMLVYYENGERKWFIPSAEDLPKGLWPSNRLLKNGAETRTTAFRGYLRDSVQWGFLVR
jgi:hypothetical protein